MSRKYTTIMPTQIAPNSMCGVTSHVQKNYHERRSAGAALAGGGAEGTADSYPRTRNPAGVGSSTTAFVTAAVPSFAAVDRFCD